MTILEQLPDRIERLESQILQLRAEVRSEFSATRQEIGSGDEETRRSLREEIRAGDEETRRSLREEIRAGDEETRRSLREEIRAGDKETRRSLREEIRAGDEETRRFSRVLHEDAIARIRVVGEGLASLTEKVETLSLKFDRTDAKVDLILARLDTPATKKRRLT